MTNIYTGVKTQIGGSRRRLDTETRDYPQCFDNRLSVPASGVSPPLPISLKISFGEHTAYSLSNIIPTRNRGKHETGRDFNRENQKDRNPEIPFLVF
jgi:hypothetical protein